MELTKDQIDQLFAFARKKYVHWYDLQVEIVDHLASDIEAEMSAHPTIGFDQALSRVYDKFGIFGFSKIVADKERALGKQTYKLWLQELKNEFTIPYIIRTLCIGAAIWLCVKHLPIFVATWFILLVSIGFMVANSLLFKRYGFGKRKEAKMNSMQNMGKRPLMMLSNLPSNNFAVFPYYIICVNPTSLGYATILTKPLAIWGWSALLLFVVMMCMTAYKLNKKMLGKAYEMYPDAFDKPFELA